MTTPLSRNTLKHHGRNKNHYSVSILSKMIDWPLTNSGHLRFFTHKAMSKIFSDNTNMYGIPENPMIDTKNTNMPLLC